MRETLTFIKRIFIDKEPALSRRDYLFLLAILWFLNSFSLQAAVIAFSSSMAMGRFFDVRLFAAHNMIGSIMNTLFLTGLPWSFALLLGSVLTFRKAYGKGVVVSILGGLLVYAFFRGLVMVPTLISSVMGSMTSSLEMQAMVTPVALGVGIAVAALALAGLALIIAPFGSLKPADAPLDAPRQGRLGRCRFVLYAFILGVVAAFFAGLTFALGLGSILDMAFQRSLGVIAVSELAVVSIMGVLLFILRMHDSGVSRLWILPALLGPALAATGIGVAMAMKNIWIYSASDYLLHLSLDVNASLFLFLALAPSKPD